MTRTVYRVRDADGVLVAEHVRIDRPDGGKDVIWCRPGHAARAGLAGLGTAGLPLYGSEHLGALDVGETLLVTEGEKAAEACWTLGYAAVGTVTGASGTPGEDALCVLLPFDVVTWEDFDEPGAAHMARVARALVRLGGGARRLRWGREKGDDAADFLMRGERPDLLELLVRGADPWAFEAEAGRRAPRPSYERRADGRVDEARSHLLQVVIEKLGPHRRRVGRSLFWPCPFHDERSPSFKVDLSEPFFRCFGCGAKGDVFTFLQRMEGLAFKDAIDELAPARLLGPIPRIGA